MNELTLKLADLLEITVDSALEVYPVLREQFIWYLSIDYILKAFVLFTFVSFFIGVIFTLYLEDRKTTLGKYKEYNKDAKFVTWDDEITEVELLIPKLEKYKKLSWQVFIITFPLSILFSILQVLVAPDILFLLEILQ